MRSEEYKVQCSVVEYLLLQYPDVEFRSDMGGIKLPIGLATKANKANGGRRGWPDLFIAEPRKGKHGLFIEIKKNHNELYTKKGQERKSVHIIIQRCKLIDLKRKGYAAYFGCGFDGCKTIIDNYLGEKK